MLYHHWFSALEDAIRRVQEKQKGMKFSGTHLLLTCADDVNIMGENIVAYRKTQKFY
jgi:hypothetical protein